MTIDQMFGEHFASVTTFGAAVFVGFDRKPRMPPEADCTPERPCRLATRSCV